MTRHNPIPHEHRVRARWAEGTAFHVLELYCRVPDCTWRIWPISKKKMESVVSIDPYGLAQSA